MNITILGEIQLAFYMYINYKTTFIRRLVTSPTVGLEARLRMSSMVIFDLFLIT